MMITIAPYIGGKPEKDREQYYIILWIIVICYDSNLFGVVVFEKRNSSEYQTNFMPMCAAS